MKRILGSLAAVLMLAACIAAAAEKAAPAAMEESWEDRVSAALDRPLGNIDWKGQPLPDVLAAIGKAAGAAVVLDPAAVKEPEKIKITLSVPKGGEMTVRAALGNVLKLAQLRYALKDQAIFVSTAERIVGDLLVGVPGPAPAVPGVSYPMTVGDAVAATVDFYDDSEEHLPQTIADFVRGPVDARFERAPYRDALGRIHFPAPPMIIQGPEILDPYARFSTKPWFLRPPYLAPMYWGASGQAVAAPAKPAVETEALKALLEYMRKNPDVTVGALLQQLEAGQLKAATGTKK
jgi:hypothetical protein